MPIAKYPDRGFYYLNMKRESPLSLAAGLTAGIGCAVQAQMWTSLAEQIEKLNGGRKHRDPDLFKKKYDQLLH